MRRFNKHLSALFNKRRSLCFNTSAHAFTNQQRSTTNNSPKIITPHPMAKPKPTLSSFVWSALNIYRKTSTPSDFSTVEEFLHKNRWKHLIIFLICCYLGAKFVIDFASTFKSLLALFLPNKEPMATFSGVMAHTLNAIKTDAYTDLTNLIDNTKSNVIWIEGLSGSGKTTLALKYLQEQKDCVTVVVDSGQYMQQMEALVLHYQLYPVASDEKTLLLHFSATLRKLHQAGKKIVLLVDNDDEAEKFSSKFHSFSNFVFLMLITSRHSQVKQQMKMFPTIKLKPFNIADCKKLFNQYELASTEEELKQLVETFGGYALDVALAVATIKISQWSISDYIQNYTLGSYKTLAPFVKQVDEKEGWSRTWQIETLMEQLKQHSKVDVISNLCTLALFDMRRGINIAHGTDLSVLRETGLADLLSFVQKGNPFNLNIDWRKHSDAYKNDLLQIITNLQKRPAQQVQLVQAIPSLQVPILLYLNKQKTDFCDQVVMDAVSMLHVDEFDGKEAVFCSHISSIEKFIHEIHISDNIKKKANIMLNNVKLNLELQTSGAKGIEWEVIESNAKANQETFGDSSDQYAYAIAVMCSWLQQKGINGNVRIAKLRNYTSPDMINKWQDANLKLKASIYFVASIFAALTTSEDEQKFLRDMIMEKATDKEKATMYQSMATNILKKVINNKEPDQEILKTAIKNYLNCIKLRSLFVGKNCRYMGNSALNLAQCLVLANKRDDAKLVLQIAIHAYNEAGFIVNLGSNIEDKFISLNILAQYFLDRLNNEKPSCIKFVPVASTLHTKLTELEACDIEHVARKIIKFSQ